MTGLLGVAGALVGGFIGRLLFRTDLGSFFDLRTWVLAFIGLALKSFRSGETVGDDPWDAQTLEWATSSPAPVHNFAEIHTVMSPEPLIDLKPKTENA